MRDLALRLVQSRAGIDCAARERIVDVRQTERWSKPGCIGYFEMVMGGTQICREAAVVIQDILQIRKAVKLICAVVNRIGAAVGGFDSQRVCEVVGRNEIVERPCRAPVADTRLNLVVAAAVDRGPVLPAVCRSCSPSPAHVRRAHRLLLPAACCHCTVMARSRIECGN